MYKKMEIEFAGRRLSLETGRLAKQSHGSVLAQYGDTMVLATVVSAYEARPNVDFLPLTVDYAEKTFAAGKIPGGFFKREGRPSEKEILTSRLIDRSMRPLFPKGYDCETQLIVTVLSADRENDSDVLSIIAASTALELSDIPHAGPVAAVRMGRIEGKLVVNPLVPDYENSDISIIVSAKPDTIAMLEGGARIVDEDTLLEALYMAHESMAPIFEMQQELKRLAGKPKRAFTPKELDKEVLAAVKESASKAIEQALLVKEKKARREAMHAAQAKAVADLSGRFADRESEIQEAFEKVERTIVRLAVVDHDRRIDDRKSTEIRQLAAQVQVLPRVHGSALFTARRDPGACDRRRSVPRQMSRRSMRCWVSATRSSCCITTSRPSRPARPSATAHRAAARSATAHWRNAR